MEDIVFALELQLNTEKKINMNVEADLSFKPPMYSCDNSNVLHFSMLVNLPKRIHSLCSGVEKWRIVLEVISHVKKKIMKY